MTLYDYCIAFNRSDLLQEWDQLNNASVTPADVTSGSHQEVWWKCKRGHQWKTPVYSRVGQESNCPYCTNRKLLVGFNDLQTVSPELAAQWDPTLNEGMKPEDVLAGSHQRVWWKCENGHQWRAAVYSRVGKESNCPYCANRKLLIGFNDLRTVRPELAKQWHPTLNEDLKPEDVLAGSSQKVWWCCEKGHVWKAKVNARLYSTNCPYCTRRVVSPGETDLATALPDVAAQWHFERNGLLMPEDVTPGSKKRVWWRCEKRHEWQATIESRSKGRGCPVCSGRKVVPGETDLKTHFPQVAAQWAVEKNGSLKPEHVSPYSNQFVWWQCKKGHQWKTAISTRTKRGTDCPYCTNHQVLSGYNDLQTLQPAIAVQWHPDLNGTLTPEMVTPGSSKSVWWRCSDGHVWKAVISSRTGKGKHGCPVCAGNVKKQRRQTYG